MTHQLTTDPRVQAADRLLDAIDAAFRKDMPHAWEAVRKLIDSWEHPVHMPGALAFAAELRAEKARREGTRREYKMRRLETE